MSTNTPNLTPSNDPNGFDDITKTEGEVLTETTETPIQTRPKTYEEMTPEELKEKLRASSKGAQALLDEKKQWELDRQDYEAKLAEKKANGGDNPTFEGYENLSSEEQENLQKYNKNIIQQAEQKIMSNPAMQKVVERENEAKWEEAYAKVAHAYPELNETKEAFKAKYFKPLNVPDNMDTLLTDFAKTHLFDRARDVAHREFEEKSKRIEDPGTPGGSGGVSAGAQPKRTLKEWQEIAKNPSKFSRLSDEYKADEATGNLK